MRIGRQQLEPGATGQIDPLPGPAVEHGIRRVRRSAQLDHASSVGEPVGDVHHDRPARPDAVQLAGNRG